MKPVGRIEIFPTCGGGGGHTVVYDGTFSPHLTPDEVLGVIASILFSGRTRPLFLETYETWARQKYNRREITALLSWEKETME